MAQVATQYYFITEPPKSRFCPICFDLLTEPYLSDCGHHVCKLCRTRLIASNNDVCPECREPDALSNARLNKFLQREINDLNVRCQHHREGCEWTGEVRDLQSHLDPDKRKCDYILLPCSFGCGERIRSGAMRDHKKRYCTKHQMSCKYCSYCSSYDIVTAKHLPICLQVPVTCPNNCKKGLKRERLQAHINECPLQVISCPFTSAGCTVKLPRNEMEKHEATAVCEHLRLLMKLHLNQETSTPPAATSTPFLYNQAPMEFIISDYHEKKEANEVWYSSPFYTHNRGYKFRLNVFPNGDGTGSGSHISIYAALMRGEYDNELEWPFEGRITFELLNWREDKNQHHHSDSIDFDRFTDPDGKFTSRLTDQETALGFGKHQFISLSDLVSTTDTEYLCDDYLKIRVSAIVYSTPLLHLTPAWQDPLISTQSGAQFTISEYSKRKQFDNEYYSPPFTTSPQDYTLCLRVFANGDGDGEGSHLSIYACIMKGQHDDSLQWPFTGTIIIELLNWLEDKEHYKEALTIDTSDDFVKVTEREFGNNTGYHQFISHSSLTSSTTKTQYLYQDCICVRVQAIANN